MDYPSHGRTEVATFHFDDAPPSDYIEGVIRLGKMLEEKADGFLGLAVGITHEDIEREGVRGKASVASIGWESVDKHMVRMPSEKGWLRNEELT